MDIHRCRFVPYPTSAINAIAFSHPSVRSNRPGKSTTVRLAIGRANGDIEIWNPRNGLWHQEIIIRGGKDRSIDGLVWTQEPDEEGADGKAVAGKLRLFSIGYTTAVTEWDLEKGAARRHASGQHGDIWCLGAQPAASQDPSRTATQSSKLVAGTIDGCLALYSLDDDDLHLQRIIVKSSSKKTRMVSIAFQSRHVAIVGCSDSSIRAYDLRNGSLLRKMTLGSDLAGGAKEIILWSVKCLPNGDIVSADSTGQVCIWDGKTLSQVQRIQSHEQDVLSLATSADGSAIVSGGMDRRTVLYRPVAGSPGRWAKVAHRRYHKHDVKAMASFEGEGLSVVVSGGPDASPVVLPLREAGLEHHRTLSYLPQQAPMLSAPKARLLVSWWEREVRIWHIGRPAHGLLNGSFDSPVEKNHKLVGRVLIKGEANITSASITREGSLLVVSTAAEIKAFSLKAIDVQHGGGLRVAKIKTLPREWACGASAVQISPDGQWVCTIQEGSKVSIAKLVTSPTQEPGGYEFLSLCQRLKRGRSTPSLHRQAPGLGSYNRTIIQVAFSADSQMLAVADLAGYIDTWILSSHDSALGERDDDDASSASSSEEFGERSADTEAANWWMTNPRSHLLPRLPAAPAVISFSEAKPASPLHDAAEDDDYLLLTVTVTMQLILLHPLRGSIADWSRQHPSSKLPNAFRISKDILKGVVWQGPRVWLYGMSSFFMLDLSASNLDGAAESGGDKDSGQNSSKKRKREHNSGAGDKMGRGALGPNQVRVAEGGEGAVRWADVDMEDAEILSVGARGESDDEDMASDESEASGELQKRRDAEAANGTGHGAHGLRRTAWFTYKYRPILGAVPLDSPDEGAEAENGLDRVPRTLEVALVERPIWDLDLPARYLSENEYER